MERPENYRQSLIATFDSCPLRAKFALEDPRRTPGHLAARGSLVHRVLHRAVKEMWEHGERRFSVEQGMELLLDTLCQMGPEVEAGDVLPLKMKEMKWARVLVTKWCENTNLDLRLMIATEERLFIDLHLPTGKTVQVTGQMDLIVRDPPHGLIVIDWKSGFRRPKAVPKDDERLYRAKEEGSGLTELGWVQWLVYSLLLFGNFPQEYDHVTFKEYHVLWDEMREARMERWQTERYQDELLAQVSLLDQAIEDQVQLDEEVEALRVLHPEEQIPRKHSLRFMPSAGTHCALCPRPRACPIMGLEKIDLATPQGRQKVAAEWIVTKESSNRYLDVLKGIVEEHGPQVVLNADGRRVVGWDYAPDGSRRFGVFEPPDVPESPYDHELEVAGRESGVVQ